MSSTMSVHIIPGDGNCLLNAILHQLTLIDPEFKNYSHVGLRFEVARFIESGVENFSATILDTCRLIYASDVINTYTENQLITRYLNPVYTLDPNNFGIKYMIIYRSDYLYRYLSDLRLDGFWCGAECLSAVANLKNVKINVYHSITQRPIIFIPHTGNSLYEINLLYNGYHYDSLLLPNADVESSGVTIVSISNIAERNIHTVANPYRLVEECRPLTIRVRCRQAIGLARQMQDFVKTNKVHFKTALRMYNTTIVPAVTYGLKTAALTYANRRRLRKYELFFLNKILRFSVDKPPTRIKEILCGKSITKKVKVQRISYWGHIHRRDSNHILSAASTYNAGPRKLGRPCFTWNDSLKQDMEYFERTSTEWACLLPHHG